MKKCFECILLFMSLSLMGCNSDMKKNEFVGTWVNENEKCKIELGNDFSFKAVNVPLDVANKYYLTFNKEVNMWQGVWSLEDKQVKLTINDSYYYLDVNTTFLSSKHRLSVKLLEESGGSLIYFDRVK